MQQVSDGVWSSCDSDLIVGELVPGLLAIGEDLPQHHSQTPHIALCGESPVHDALWGHPADRQHRMTAHLQRESSPLQKPTRVSMKLSLTPLYLDIFIHTRERVLHREVFILLK